MKPLSLRNQLVMTVLLVLALSLIYSFLTAPAAVTKNYSDFQKDVTSGLVTNVERSGTTLTVTLKDNTKYASESDTTQTSQYTLIQDWLTAAGLKPDSINYKVNPSSEGSWLLTLLFTVLPVLLIGGFLIIILRQAQRGNNQALGFGKSKARLSITPATKITFADVAGVDEAKVDLQEVVEFLKYPEKFESLGAKIPRGVLLVGAPGVGKTLIARAVSGEANVPFFSISGSEFVELFVGVGAARTRDLFDQAKRNAPCLTGDTLITLADGSRIAIKEMYEREMVGTKVVSMTPKMILQPATVKAITRRRAPDLYEIATNLGTVKATGNHLFPLLRNGRVIWEAAENLQESDRVAAPRIIRTEDQDISVWDLLPDQTRAYFDDGKFLKLGMIRDDKKKLDAATRLAFGGGGFRDTKINRFPQTIPPSFAYAAGLIAADGCYLSSKISVTFTNTEPVLNKLFADTFEELFGYRPSAYLSKKNFDLVLPQGKNPLTLKDCYNTHLSNKLIVILLKAFEDRLLSLPRPLVAAWLRGVFDGDGFVRTTVGNEQIVISSYNPTANNTIRAALLRLGIATSRRSDWINHFDGNIIISDRDYQRIFIEEVGSFHPAKIGQLALLTNRLKRMTSSRLDSIPVDNLLREARLSLGMGQRSFRLGHQVSAYERGLHSPSRISLLARVQEMDNWRENRKLEESPALKDLRNLASGDIMWAKIQSIRKLEPSDYVYDLVLDEHHNFVGNELVVHNCIIFIDELDAIGRHRGSGLGNSNDEREQTLNQILVEMDGFDTKSNVIVIAATNRPDILDPALLRPGRFDRQVMLDKPDVRGRLAILQVHVKGKPLDKDVNLEILAHLTIGFSGADLANLANEGAILAARNGHKVITQSDMAAALDRIAIGPERKSRLISDEEKRIIAIHEGGHALVQRMLPKCDPVNKVTILGRGMALGFTASLPTEDRYLQSRSEFRDKLAGLLAGNTAEQIVLGDTTTGASNDIEKATQIARAMVTKFGMSEKLGPVTFGRAESSIFLNREINEQRDYSDSLANQIDQEIKALIEEAQRRAHEVVTKYRDLLSALVDKLIVVETLEAEEFEKLFTGLPKDLTI